jgi:hypothetical protein
MGKAATLQGLRDLMFTYVYEHTGVLLRSSELPCHETCRAHLLRLE